MSLAETLSSLESAYTLSGKKSNNFGNVSFTNLSNSSNLSKVDLKNDLELKSLPEIVNEEDLTAPSIKSTEEICSEVDCFTFKDILDPSIAKAYYQGEVPSDDEKCNGDTYVRLAKAAKIAPVKRIIDSLQKSSIDLQYYGLDPRQLKPLSEALMNNKSVEQINLTGNLLNIDALYHFGQMIRKNKTIQKLNLQHCKIGPDGAEMLGNGLEICDHLVDLDLSYNDLGDKGMEVLAIKLGYNISIKNLNLSHNDLTHQSGFWLAETMEENITLQVLNLSWNRIAEEPGLKHFLTTAAERNESLLKLDLSWNTLTGIKIANVIKNVISDHKTLQDINISFNRLETAPEMVAIAKGLNSSVSLKMLNMSYNGLTADTAFTLLSSIKKNTTLRTLHLDNVWVKPEFEKLRRELEAQTGLKVAIDGVMEGVDIRGPDMQALLLKRANFLGNKHKKNKKDFGWFLLRLQEAGNLTSVTKAKFETLLKEDNIKLDNGMVDEFVKIFKDDKKKVDLNLMLEKYLILFPNTTLPIPKQKKTTKSKESKKIKEYKEKEVKTKPSDENKVEPSLTNKEKLSLDFDNKIIKQSIKSTKRSSLKIDEIQSQNLLHDSGNEEISSNIEELYTNEPIIQEEVEKLELEINKQEHLIENLDKSKKRVRFPENEETISLTSDKVKKSEDGSKLGEVFLDNEN